MWIHIKGQSTRNEEVGDHLLEKVAARTPSEMKKQLYALVDDNFGMVKEDMDMNFNVVVRCLSTIENVAVKTRCK